MNFYSVSDVICVIDSIEAIPDRTTADPTSHGRISNRASELRVAFRSRRSLCGLRIDFIDRKLALQDFAEAVASGQRHVFSFCNMHTLNQARIHADMRAAMSGMTVYLDGIGANIASILVYGQSFPENLNGTDLVPDFLASHPRPLRLFLVGSPNGVAEIAASKLAERYGHISVVGTSHGYLTPGQSISVAQRIAALKPDMVLVGMGQPQQELWVSKYLQDHCGTIVCVGALIDFLADRIPRAPKLMRMMKLEWLFRLSLEPRRLYRRYLLDPYPLFRSLMSERQAHRMNSNRRSGK